MTSEPVMDAGATAVEGGGVLIEERRPESETTNPAVGDALLTDESGQAFLVRWAEIQVGFVEDPANSLQDADGLIDEIATALLESFQARRIDLAAAWQHGSPGTEDLRLALRRYREFLGVVIPK